MYDVLVFIQQILKFMMCVCLYDMNLCAESVVVIIKYNSSIFEAKFTINGYW